MNLIYRNFWGEICDLDYILRAIHHHHHHPQKKKKKATDLLRP